MALTDLGRVCPVARGEYVPTTNYTRLDIVTFEGSSYICKANSTGNSPINTTYWQVLAQGALGEAGTPNKQNILRNWDMRNPLNQRAASGEISTAGYFYDRWLLNSGIVTTNANYLTVGAGAVIEQRIEGNLLAGAVVTVSVMAAGMVINNTGTMPIITGTASVTLAGWGTATLGYATGYMYVRLSPTAASNIQAVKLELGTISTLAYDPPMDFWTQVMAYDIGDILITLNASSPASRFPGTTWSAIDSGRFLVAAGTGYAAGATGGAASVALTVGNLPNAAPKNLFVQPYGGVSPAGGGARANLMISNDSYGPYTTAVKGTLGDGTAHENRPPYYAVYMWERTA